MSQETFIHALNHPHVRAVEHDIAANPETSVGEGFWRMTMGLVRSDAERSHREAAMVMHQFQATHRPFGLYLRSFEAEAYEYFSKDVVPDHDGGTVTTTQAGPSAVEQKIAQALRDRLPMLAVANPSQLLTSRALVPRLQLPNEGWQAYVKNLIEHAHLIVMDCDALAPGVIWELESIAELQRQDSTIVILPSQASGATDRGLQTVVEILGGVVKRQERLSGDDARFAGYRRLASEDEIDFDHIEAAAPFADLLANAAEKAALAPEFNAPMYARSLNNQGVELADAGRFGEAIQLHTQALLVRRHIDDSEGIMVSLRNLGIAYTDAGGDAQALPFFDEALKQAWQLKRENEAGEIAAYKGFCHKRLGQREEAIKWLRAGYAMQAGSGRLQEIESTLRQLAEVHREAGEGDLMLQCFVSMREHNRKAGNRAGELRANLMMAETYWLAGRGVDALKLFEEGLLISRELADTNMENLCSAAINKLHEQQ